MPPCTTAACTLCPPTMPEIALAESTGAPFMPESASVTIPPIVLSYPTVRRPVRLGQGDGPNGATDARLCWAGCSAIVTSTPRARGTATHQPT